jgi:nucleotide-binding universal stress UspA family protein
MTRILVGVDGSELANRAAQQAVALLGGDRDVTVVQVVRPVTPLTLVPGSAITGIATVDDRTALESQEAQIREAEAEIAATAAALGCPADTRVVVGDPGPDLCRLAGEEEFDLLVVGSHGSGFLKRVLLGSVSHHVLHHAPCPVLVVREAPDTASLVPEKEAT